MVNHLIPTDPFKLNNKKLNFNDIKNLEIANKPICHIYKTQGKYHYLEIDFITCDWCLSSEGQAHLQSKLNMELLSLWLRGYNLKLNYTSVGHMTIFLRADFQTIEFLINQLNMMSSIDAYWYQYRIGNCMQYIERDEGYVSPIKHVKNNVNKVKA
ncbi:hypothetical protein PYI52_07970 [Staphylococcus epidermidis]|uniref:hypothetical protein n=1 Tax=Staphylococcus TaxID=1279 RepID=UPI0008A8580F|nr:MULTISPECIES: hypothetical protein [Staphylococcus]MDH8743528.1 hypothetical protein [Staphylococcus epidermidis]MDW4096019.1 hypothetical protein [Staphylococcus saprophyticus]MCC3712005.1 hypothetical protein [Staphylococcus hominis]MCC9117355.1 hypothetical protein [Staphylococcus capitis]MCC9143838.1 hypothetical protein [Staphylococcus capitis]